MSRKNGHGNALKSRFHDNFRRLFLSTALAVATLTAPTIQAQMPSSDGPPPLILVSIDGFRPDYLNRNVTPNLNALAATGVRAEAMHPSFPSKTFPNHYTLVTGLRPDRHGIVDNTMEDSAIPGVRFHYSNQAAVTDRRWWDQAEPIWVSAEKNGIRAATMFWPGSEAPIQGVRPSEWKVFNGKLPANDRVDTLLGWLDRPVAQRPGFLTLYFDNVDHAGHEFGPDARQTTAAAQLVDAAIGRLLQGLEKLHIAANLVIVADHGMAAISSARAIRFDLIAPAGSYRMVTSGPYAGIEAAAGQDGILAEAILKPHDHMQCWRKENIPPRLHYGKNPRVPSFFCLAELGWVIAPNAKAADRTIGGTHGYDNLAPEMEALFIASGPAFERQLVLAPFENVDVYPLMMKLLGLQALPSDGNLTPFARALKGARPALK